MKKIMTLVVALACAATTFAQTPEVGSISIKPMIGLSLATMSNADGSKARVGFVGGAEGQYQLSDIFAISAGLLYSQQGMKYNSSSSSSATMKNDYLNIPVLLNAYVAPGLAVKLGVQPGFAVSKKISSSSDGTSASTDLFKDLYKSFDVAIPIGISYEISHIVLDARYNWGILNVLNKDITTYTDKSSTNGVFQFTVGYRF